MKKKKEIKRISKFSELYKKNKRKKKPKQFWAGIVPKTVGFIVGPAKSGKTILCENLAFSIASGRKKFLGLTIGIKKCKVLFISMEEDSDIRIINRGKNQYRGYSKLEKKNIDNNLYYSNKNFIRSVNEKNYKYLKQEINDLNPDLVIIDSTNRFNIEIEDRSSANKMMQKMTEIAQKCNVAVLLIHHTTKSLQGNSMTLNSLAGSSALSRDADFFIGVNKTQNGIRYIKFIDNRYSPVQEKCKIVSIQSNSLIDLETEEYEIDILKKDDKRFNETNTEIVKNYIKNECIGGPISSKKLQDYFVNKEGLITKKTLYNQLNKLKKEGFIEKIGHGKYNFVKKK